MTDDEQWAPIEGWPGYEVSNRGRVRSWRRWSKGKCLRLIVDADGYARVNLMVDQRRVQAGVHRLVLTAFGEPPEGHKLVRHLDGNPANNDIANLAWGTCVENEADKKRHGTAMVGTRHHAAKLTDEDVRVIRDSSERGAVLAARFGISQTAISRIRRRQTWQHVA